MKSTQMKPHEKHLPKGTSKVHKAKPQGTALTPKTMSVFPRGGERKAANQ